MPSGRSSGGGHCGGSHSSGGGHFGGGGSRHSSGGVFSGFSRGVRGGRSVMFINIGGRRYYAGSWVGALLSLMIFALIVSVMCALGVGSTITGNKMDLARMENDYKRYQAMISFAEENPEYITYGTIEAILPCEQSSKGYYIEYSFGPDGCKKGYTYCIYSVEDLDNPALKKGKPYKLALDAKESDIINSNIDVDSVNFDYKDTKIEDDFDYVSLKAEIRSMRGLRVGSLLFAGVMIALMVLIVVKSLHKDTPENAVSSAERMKALTTHCEYCGGKVSASEPRCPSCGAKLK